MYIYIYIYMYIYIYISIYVYDVTKLCVVVADCVRIQLLGAYTFIRVENFHSVNQKFEVVAEAAKQLLYFQIHSGSAEEKNPDFSLDDANQLCVVVAAYVKSKLRPAPHHQTYT